MTGANSPSIGTPARTMRAEAMDPGTSFDRLRALAHTFPREVLANPAFDLAIVTDPSFLLSMPERGLCALVRQPSFPPDLMEVLAQRLDSLENRGSRVAVRIAAHPRAPRAALARLTDEPLASLNVNAPGAFAEPWINAVHAVTRSYSHRSARLRPCSGDARVLAGLARHGFIDGHDPYVAALILGDGPSTRGRYLRAQRSMSPEIVREFMRESAERAHVDRAGIMSRARDPIFSNASRRHEHRVAFCGSIGAQDDPGLLARSRKMVDRMRASMGGIDRVPDALLPALAHDRVWRVRAAVALRPQLPSHVAWILARDRDSRVRANLAGSVEHEDVLRHLAQDLDLKVQHALLHNPALPHAVGMAIASSELINRSMAEAWASGIPLGPDGAPLAKADQSDAWTGVESAMLAVRHAYNALPKVAFLAGPRCPMELLLDESDSACWWTRIAVARNPRTPREVVEGLAAGDGTWLVRAAASERLAAPPSERDLPDPIPASECCERYMRPDLRRRVTAMRTTLKRSPEQDVLQAIDAAMADPELRPVLMAGMLVGRTRVRLTSFSEIGRSVSYQLSGRAEERVAQALGMGAAVDGAQDANS